jgi:hypothetical protein
MDGRRRRVAQRGEVDVPLGPAAEHSSSSQGYTHDGEADTLFQNAAGKVAEWQMDGDHVVDSLTVGSHSPDWHMV